MVRVAAYIDGFNLYFGLKDKYARRDMQENTAVTMTRSHWPVRPCGSDPGRLPG
jgi:hypothetical protein